MSAFAPIDPKTIDDIRVFLPDIGEEEYALRRRIRSASNVALKAIGDLPDCGERCLFQCMREAADAWRYKPASIETLGQVVDLLLAINRAAQIAARLEARHA